MRVYKRMALAFIAAGILLAVMAQATTNQLMSFDIAPLPIVHALDKFSAQSGLQIINDSEHPAGVTSGRLSGAYTGREAIEPLLAGTRFDHEYVDERTIRISDRKSRSVRLSSIASARRLQLAQASERKYSPASHRTSPPRVETKQVEGGGAREYDSRDLEEVIVSAQKRDERIQDVPISISLLSGEELERSSAQGVTEALSRVPGVTTNVNVQGGGTQVTVRGVTAAAPLAAGSGPVAYYLDSAPFGFVTYAIAPDANAYDLARVEVLRGPQGTLYGASALNGVVRVLTHNADLNRFDFKARTSISSTQDGGDDYRGDMAVNVPIVQDVLAIRAVGGYQSLSGWIDRPNNDNANDAEIGTARVRVGAQPTDNLSIGLSAWISRADYDAPSTGDDNGRHRSLIDEPISNDYDVYGLKIDYELPWFSLASMTNDIAYRSDSVLDQTIIGSTTLRTTLESQVFSQEIVLNSLAERPWRWSAGGIYREAEDGVYQLRPTYLVPTDQSISSDSFAVFGEITRGFFDGKLELTGGLRYFEDEVTSQEYSRLTGVPPSQLVHTEAKFDALSPRVVLTWHPTDEMTIYSSYSEGFRSGAHQQPAVIAIAPEFRPVDADTLRNYELGAKGTLWDRRITFDTAVYYIDWVDVQQALSTQVLPGPPPVFFTTLVNGESASGVGVDFGVTIEPVADLELSATLGWNDLTMDADVFSRGLVLFREGDRLDASPECTVGASADYTFSLGSSGFKGQLSTSANYTSEQDTRGILGPDVVVSRGDELVIARASFTIHAHDHWAATLFVDNLTDERGSPKRTAIRSLLPEWDDRVRPRTIGAQLEYRL